jgi:hypothetical protein
MNLNDKSEPARLRFDSADDALDYADELVKRFNCMFAIQTLDFAKRYEESEIELAFECRFRPEGVQFHLVFRAIPYEGFGDAEVAGPAQIHTEANRCGYDWNKDGVCTSVACFFEGEQKLIPSTIRLEPAQERVNLFWHIFAVPFKGVFKTSGSSREREVSIFRIGKPGEGNGVKRLVQSIAEVSKSVSSDFGEFEGKISGQPDFVNDMVRLVRVGLSKGFVWGLFEELLDFPFEVGNMILSPCDLAPGTVEGVRHSWDCISLKQPSS